MPNEPKKYFLQLSYLGTNYHGWQRQPKFKSVQETVEKTLSKVLGADTKVHGCGRTDAGVHASHYFAHFKGNLDPDKNSCFVLNKNLPHDIAAHAVFEVPMEADAQKSATNRSYQYQFHSRENALISLRSTLFQEKVSMAKMEEAAALLLQYEDFHSFCKTPDKHFSTHCKLEEVDLRLSDDGSQAFFTFKGNHFLKSMIRIMVYELWQVGRGKLSLETFESWLKTPTTRKNVIAAPPQGLHLKHIEYPFDVPKAADYNIFSTE